MELWFSENHTQNVKFSIKVNKQLFSEISEFQLGASSSSTAELCSLKKMNLFITK